MEFRVFDSRGWVLSAVLFVLVLAVTSCCCQLLLPLLLGKLLMGWFLKRSKPGTVSVRFQPWHSRHLNATPDTALKKNCVSFTHLYIFLFNGTQSNVRVLTTKDSNNINTITWQICYFICNLIECAAVQKIKLTTTVTVTATARATDKNSSKQIIKLINLGLATWN